MQSCSIPIFPNADESAPDQVHISSAMMEQIRLAGLFQSEVLAVGHHAQGCAACWKRLRGVVVRPEPRNITPVARRPVIGIASGF